MQDQPWPPPDLNDWMREALADTSPPWWLDKIIPADAITLVSGDAKLARKTWSAMEMVRSLAAGQAAGGLTLGQPTPCRVLFLEYEGPAKPLALFWQWMGDAEGWHIPEGRVSFAHRYSHVRLTDPQWADKIVTLVKEGGYKGVVLDTFTRSAMAPENDAQAMNAAFGVLDRIRNATGGGWVMYIHHLRKNSDPWEEDIDVQVRGNSAFSGAYDHHLAFRCGATDDAIHLYTRSKIDQERYFRWVWAVNATTGRIRFNVVEFDLDVSPTSAEVHECTTLIETNAVLTLKQLGTIWDMPKPVTEWMVDAMRGAGLLEPSARGFRKVTG